MRAGERIVVGSQMPGKPSRLNSGQPGPEAGAFARSLRGRPMLFTITWSSNSPFLLQIEMVRLLPAAVPLARHRECMRSGLLP